MGGDIGGAARGLRLRFLTVVSPIASDYFPVQPWFSFAHCVRWCGAVLSAQSRLEAIKNADSTRFRKLWDEGYARIPVVLLLPSDLKRLVQFVRAAVERQLPHQAPAGESESAPSKKPDSLSS